MVYIICTSAFHVFLAKDIERKLDDVHVVYIKKKSRISFFNFFKGVYYIVKCFCDRDAQVVVPHVFNPWFSVFVSVASKRSFFDDGIAYYYDAITPRNFLTELYVWISRRANPRFSRDDLGEKTYAEYLMTSESVSFFCIYPDLIVDGCFNKVPLDPEGMAPDTPGAGSLIYLDSRKEMVSFFNPGKIVSFLRNEMLKNGKEIVYFKPHPSQRSQVSSLLEEESWAVEVSQDYEEMLVDINVEALYSIYSSATISTSIIYPNVKLCCLTTGEIDSRVGEVRALFEREMVEFVYFDAD